LPGLEVLEEGTASFKSKEEATSSPLAQRLFEIQGVEGVFFGSDFITVTKNDDKEWYLLKPSILGIVMEHFTAGRPVLLKAMSTDADDDGAEDSEIVVQIKELIDTRVRPAVAMDGGDIVYHGFDDGVVYLKMHGACDGCPSAGATLKIGIENMLRHYIPEVQEVQAV